MNATRVIAWHTRFHKAPGRSMGRAARAEYEARYTPERNYEQLMRIYSRVIQER